MLSSLLVLSLVSAPIDTKVTLALRQVHVPTVVHLLAEVAELRPEVDACLDGARVDVDVKAVRVRDVLDLLEARVGAVSTTTNGTLHVTCKAGTLGRPARPHDQPRLSSSSSPGPELPSTPEALRAAFEALERDVPALVDRIADPTVALDALLRMFVVDQGVRKLADREATGALMGSIDAFNTSMMKAMLTHVDWFVISKYGIQADNHAWLFVQHADRDVAFQKVVLARLEKLVDKRETSRSSYAYLFDRVAVNEGRTQRFGTQGLCTGPGNWEPHLIEDAAHVDEQRAWAEISGFPKLADYVAHMRSKCSSADPKR